MQSVPDISSGKIARRKPMIALLLSLICPGLGLLYAGRLKAAIGVFAIMVIGMPWSIAVGAVAGGDTWTILVAYTAMGLAAVVFQSVWSVRAAARAGDSYVRRRFNHIGVYLGFIALNLLSPSSRIIKHFVVETFKVSSQSMSPGLLSGDYIAAVKGKAPEPGDVVVLRRPQTEQEVAPDTAFVYRIVAVGGQRVEMRSDRLYIDGAPLARVAKGTVQQESLDVLSGNLVPRQFDAFEETLGNKAYRVYETPGFEGDFPAVTVPSDSFFVLGDNRDNANDSRYWGTLPAENVIGIAETIWLSISPQKSVLRTERIGMGI